MKSINKDNLVKLFYSGKKALVAAGLSSVIFPANGQVSSIVNCADIEDSAARLACYDEVSSQTQNLPVIRLPRNSVNTSIEASENSSAASDDLIRGDAFGLELNATGNRTRTYRVIAAKRNNFTGWTIEFDGGGKWRQEGTDKYDVNVGETYTLRRSSLNSFLLSNSNNNRKIRLKRQE